MSWHSWTKEQADELIVLWDYTIDSASEMATSLSEDFGVRVRRKDVIMKLWLLADVGLVEIRQLEKWRLEMGEDAGVDY